MKKSMKKTAAVGFTMTTLAILLSGCGGGGGGGGILSTGTGFVTKGPVVGAGVYIDMDNSHSYTAGDTLCGTTIADGSFVCTYPSPLTATTNTHLLIARGGTDTFTGATIDVNTPMLAPPGATQVSPLTNLVVLQAAAGVTAGTAVPVANLNTANNNVVAAMGLPAGTPLATTNSMTNPAVLAAETAVQTLMDQVVASVAAATKVPTASLATSANTAMAALAATMNTGAVVPLNVAAVTTVATSITTAANALVGATAGATAVNVNNVANLVSTTIAASVAVTQAATGSVAAVQTATANATSSSTALTYTVQSVPTILASTAGNASAAQITAVTTPIFTAAQTAVTAGAPVAAAINAAAIPVGALTTLNTTLSVGAPAPVTVVVTAPTIPNVTNVLIPSHLMVAGNGSLPTGFTPAAVPTSTLDIGTATIPMVGVTRTGLTSAAMTLTADSVAGAVPGGFAAVTAATGYKANIGVSITPVSALDARRFQAVIKGIPLTVTAGVLGIPNMTGATLSAYAKNTAGTQFNVAIGAFPVPLITTGASAVPGIPAGSTDVTLNITNMMSTLVNTAVGGNAGFTNMSQVGGSYTFSIVLEVLDAAGNPVKLAQNQGTAGAVLNTSTSFAPANTVAVTNNVTVGSVTGQGALGTVILK